VPVEVLTERGKVFTGRSDRPPVEVLFDRGAPGERIERLLIAPRWPTTTGKSPLRRRR
jgi:hypothetical protein